MSLYSNAYNQYGGRAARKIKEFFNAMQLPEPSEGEYSETHDKGYLVFLNDPGVVIRITRANLTLWDHPRVLQPLGSVPAGKLRIDINPGIHCPATEEQRNEAMDDLTKDNLQLFDPALYNCGTLPAVTNLIKAGYAVALDPVAVDDISRTATWARKLLGSKFSQAAAPKYDPQAILYGHLRETFKAAWKNGGAQPDATGIKVFWQECREMKAAKKLVASWLTQDMASRNYKNAYEGSLHYGLHMKLQPSI